MICPDCRGDLVGDEIRDIPIDRCSRCGGTWFDLGEIERARPSLLADGMGSRAVWSTTSAGWCPKCAGSAPMVAGEAGDIALARCGGCKGIWLSNYKPPTVYLQPESDWRADALSDIVNGILDGIFRRD